MVEYIDGGKPNVEGCSRLRLLITPRKVFEKAYTLGARNPPPSLDCLKAEAAELEERWGKLKVSCARVRGLAGMEQKDRKI